MKDAASRPGWKGGQGTSSWLRFGLTRSATLDAVDRGSYLVRMLEDYVLSRNVDAVLWRGQAEELNEFPNCQEFMVPASEEVREQFVLSRARLLHAFRPA